MDPREEARFNRAYDVLVEYAGAPPGWRGSFIYDHADRRCDEWRFQGHLGMGGKFRRLRFTIDCYREDETPERLVIIKMVNKLLAQIY